MPGTNCRYHDRVLIHLARGLHGSPICPDSLKCHLLKIPRQQIPSFRKKLYVKIFQLRGDINIAFERERLPILKFHLDRFHRGINFHFKLPVFIRPGRFHGILIFLHARNVGHCCPAIRFSLPVRQTNRRRVIIRPVFRVRHVRPYP